MVTEFPVSQFWSEVSETVMRIYRDPFAAIGDDAETFITPVELVAGEVSNERSLDWVTWVPDISVTSTTHKLKDAVSTGRLGILATETLGSTGIVDEIACIAGLVTGVDPWVQIS